jgi:hypothetical protein
LLSFTVVTHGVPVIRLVMVLETPVPLVRDASAELGAVMSASVLGWLKSEQPTAETRVTIASAEATRRGRLIPM